MIRKVVPAADKAVLSMSEACGYLGVCYNTLMKLINNGDIRPVRAGRRYLFPRQNIQAFLEQDALIAKAYIKKLR